MSGRAPVVVTASLAVFVVVAGALIWKAYGPADPDRVQSPAVAASTETPAEDTAGPQLDLDHLSEADLAFLERTLLEGPPEARLSAAKALLVAERLEGATMLFEAAAQGGDDALTLCLAGLEVLRLQRAEDTLRALLRALRRGGELPEGCRVELADRFALVSRGQQQAVLNLSDDADPEVRAWVAETASGWDSPAVLPVLLALAADAEALVRRSAWLGLQERPLDAQNPGLVAAASQEADARNVEILETMGLR